MMLAGTHVAVASLARKVRLAGAYDLGERTERALKTRVQLLALTLDERSLVLGVLEDSPDELAAAAY